MYSDLQYKSEKIYNLNIRGAVPAGGVLLTDERGVCENQRIQGGLRADGDITSSFFLGNHNIITVKTIQYLLPGHFYRQGIQIKVIGVDYTCSILFTGLGDSNLSVGGQFQYLFPDIEGRMLNHMIAGRQYSGCTGPYLPKAPGMV